MTRSRPVLLVLALLAALAACDDTPTMPGTPDPDAILVLNSTGQALASFDVSSDMITAGPAFDLGAGFDGVSVDVGATHAVTTVSSFGGSRVLFVDLATGSVSTTTFPTPETSDANPSRASFDDAGNAWFAGRGSNAVYRATPGQPVATRLSDAAGTFVERVLVVDDEVYAIDAYLDDDGGTFAPLGPSRVFVFDEINGLPVDFFELPAGAFNAIDAVRVRDRIVVLLGGTLSASFQPNGDGALVVVDPSARTTGPLVPLGGNGVSIELGADGLIYVTATSDFVSLDLLRFNAGTGSFVNGPTLPFEVRDASAARVDCWVATGLADGRVLCATFAVAEAGRLLLVDDSGAALAETAGGFGTSDLVVR